MADTRWPLYIIDFTESSQETMTYEIFASWDLKKKRIDAKILYQLILLLFTKYSVPFDTQLLKQIILHLLTNQILLRPLLFICV